ncbi:3-oxoacyl-[acyl-carrier-protein] synthase III C-terminal domain-containing protein [Streptomyces sp. NBC_01089]|uniref:3-oxoacyl-[acyl-carrier-protein] synthase III C-terminal domain-containing protein n=1 Tax=Streptomyces sp. NBC_01089 TaxID=2903747 RepID=UPI00386F971F|nr:PhlD [Streptomyces sp. NBC_01089]
MPAYVSRPAIVLPQHEVSTREIIDDIARNHPDDPRLKVYERVIGNLQVDKRYFVSPLDSPAISGDADITERVGSGFGHSVRMGEQAARQAMARAGVQPSEIGAIVTSHATTWGIPGHDVLLSNALGLPMRTRRIAMTTVACAGGIQALVRAVQLAALEPGSKVLVVVSEVISSVYNHHDTTMQSMIYKALFGDSAGACVVSTTAPGTPGIRIEDPVSANTFELLLPDTEDLYSGKLDTTGLHFDSTKAGQKGALDSMPYVLDWLDHKVPDWAVIHPGSPSIITDVAKSLGLTEEHTRHSRAVLAEMGNLGGISVLAVLDKLHSAPPAAGESGVAVAFGPGFVTAALRCSWSGAAGD